MSLSQVFKWNTVVDFADTDAGGVVYNARYLEWTERARASWFRDCKLSNQYLWQQGIVFAVSRAEIDFKRPAQLDDYIRVDTTVNNVRPVRLIVSHNIYRKDDDNLLCACNVTLACLDHRKKKPIKIPISILNQLIS
ncbi:MAG: YbgC/FadM family acyl-CoA thioesterase [Cyanobacteria bacterium P01_A01_bin.80]